MEDFLTYLITPLLSTPDALKIENDGRNLIISVDDADVGRIIGKHGNIINALRALLRTYCSINKLSFVNLSVNAPAKSA